MKVELHPAHCYDCDSCGSENFLRAIVRNVEEMSAEDIVEAKRRYPDATDEDFKEGFFLSAPEQVTCGVCGRTFDVLHEGVDDGNEELQREDDPA